MNYFERLVRRALLRPASAPGTALEDPFAAVAEWPLETPTTRPASDAAAPIAAQRPVEPVRAAVSPGEQPPPPPALAIEQPPAAVLEPPSAAAAEASRSIAPSAEESALPPADKGSLPAAPLEPQRDALALADAFMRSIGVQSQLAELPPEHARQADAPKPNLAIVHDEKPAAVARSAQVVPPPSERLPAPAARPAARAIESARPAPEPPHERRAEAPARTRTVIETRHVLVERNGATSSEDLGVSGGGAPRFGLGQL